MFKVLSVFCRNRKYDKSWKLACPLHRKLKHIEQLSEESTLRNIYKKEIKQISETICTILFAAQEKIYLWN